MSPDVKIKGITSLVNVTDPLVTDFIGLSVSYEIGAAVQKSLAMSSPKPYGTKKVVITVATRSYYE